MCDCYTGVCDYCGRTIEIHIGDFSAGSTNVRAWCPKCHNAMLEFITTWLAHHNSNVPWLLFRDIAQSDDPHNNVKKGDVFFFLVDMPRSIHLN